MMVCLNNVVGAVIADSSTFSKHRGVALQGHLCTLLQDLYQASTRYT